MVLTKNANVGDIVTPFSSASGTTGAVVMMADMKTLEVEADVSEASIAKITVGQPAEIQLDAFPDLRLAGKVSRVVPTVDRSKATLLVKVKFVEPDARVLPDMSAKIGFLSRSAGGRRAQAGARGAPGRDRQARRWRCRVRRHARREGGGGRVKSQPVTTGENVGDLVRVDARARHARGVDADEPSPTARP